MTVIRGSGAMSGGCFTADTLVSVPGGTKAIKDIQIGDIVCSFDDKGKIHEGKVLKVHEHENERVVRYKLWGGQCLDATPNHWVLNQFNAFAAIGSLGSDDCLVDEFNHLLPIVSRTEIGEHTVYNLTVEGHHTFIANTIRVHNAGLGLKIVGSGGGSGSKGGGGSPEESPDNLQSTQYARVLDLISEGEIQGIEGGQKGVYLDGTPVQASNGSNNFKGYTFDTRTGTQGQTYIPGSMGPQSEEPVGVEILKDTPHTVQIQKEAVDRVRVTITIPQLQRFEDDGDIRGTAVSFDIQVQYNGGGFTTVKEAKIKGKSSSSYQRDYIIPLTGAKPVDIRVTRKTKDSTNKNIRKTVWSSYTEIIDEKFSYPNSALCFLKFDARQFRSIPQRRYLVRGIKVKVPHNAVIDTTTHLGRITYNGLFNGSLGFTAWTNDPAWLLYDLLTNTRYGAGIPESSLDVFDFYSISKYCNTLVPDGKGGLEPRFSCNMVINTRKEVYTVITELTNLFRGISYYGAGTLVLNQDRPTDSSYQIGPSNVVDGQFVYSGTALKTRHTCATVAYQSYEDLGETRYEYVELADQVSKYGVVNKDIRAIGCYSQGQAHRIGKWLLLTEGNLTDTVTFTVSLDSGLILRPGVVIDIADPVKSGTRRSGRISSATTTQITIDSTTDLSVSLSESPTISVMMPTGLVETKTVSDINGAVITISGEFSEAPNAQAVFLIQTTDVQSNQFRVISVVENVDDATYAVTALQYNESIYNAIENDVSLTQRDITSLSGAPDPVSNITGSEYLYEEGQGVHVGFTLSWTAPPQNVSEYKVFYRIEDDNFMEVTTLSPSIELLSLKPGSLEVKVQGFNFIGKGGSIAEESFEIAGKTAPPGNVQNLTIESISSNSARLKWDETVDLDVKNGGKVHVRHSALTNGNATFSNSVDLIKAIAGSSTDVVVPLLEGEYIVKFADDSGNLSTGDASVIVDQPDSLGKLVAKNHREDQQTPNPFQGTHDSTFYSSLYDALTLDGDDLIDNVTDFDAMVSIDSLGDVQPLGTYTFSDTLDLGLALDAVELQRRFVTRAFLPNDTVDSRTALLDDWTDIDGDEIVDVNAEMYVRSTSDDPSGSPTYGDWVPFNSGTFKGRAFQFKAELTSDKIDENILVDELGYKVELDPRSDQSNAAIASGTSTKSVTFEKPFFVGTATTGGVNAYLPSVGVTVQNLGANERFNISNVSSTGFDIDVLDSSNNNVNRNFTYTANGYGKGQ
jgi:predicted phage tail protein